MVRPLQAGALVVAFFTLIFIVYLLTTQIGHTVKVFLTDLGTKLRSFDGPTKILSLGSIVIFTTFPFTIGFSASLTLCGFVLGFPLGLIPAYCGAIIGAVIVFTLVRRYGRGIIMRKYGSKKLMVAARRAIDNDGFRMILLIRLAPWPFSITNSILAISSTSFSNYILATCISSIKTAYYVYIGSSVESLLHATNFDSRTMIALLVGFILMVVTTYYIYVRVKREVNKYDSEMLPLEGIDLDETLIE